MYSLSTVDNNNSSGQPDKSAPQVGAGYPPSETVTNNQFFLQAYDTTAGGGDNWGGGDTFGPDMAGARSAGATNHKRGFQFNPIVRRSGSHPASDLRSSSISSSMVDLFGMDLSEFTHQCLPSI
jgi:hypothetical protein